MMIFIVLFLLFDYSWSWFFSRFWRILWEELSFVLSSGVYYFQISALYFSLIPISWFTVILLIYILIMMQSTIDLDHFSKYYKNVQTGTLLLCMEMKMLQAQNCRSTLSALMYIGIQRAEWKGLYNSILQFSRVL